MLNFLRRMHIWPRRRPQPPPESPSPVNLDKEVQRHQVGSYKVRRQARRAEHMSRRVAELLRLQALGYEGLRAADEALEFLEKARRDDSK